MAVELAVGYVSVVPSARGFGAALRKEIGSDLDTVGGDAGETMSKGFVEKFRSGVVGKLAAVVGGAFAASKIGQGLSSSIGNATDLNETISKVGVVFGDSSALVEQFAAGADKSLGQSKQSALDAAATFATFGKGAGLSGDQLAGFATNLTGLSSDLASFSNTTPEEAIEAIGAALRGESEPIRKYGVLLDDATLRNRALALGLIATTKDALTPQQKVLAAQAEIMAQTGDAQGDFARTSDGAANKQRILSAEAKNASAEFGQALLPAYTAIVSIVAEKLLPALTTFTTFLGEHKGVAVALGIAVGTIVVAAFTAWAISAAAAAAATLLAAAPIIAIVAGVALLVAGIILLVTHFDIVKNAAAAAFGLVKDIAMAAFNWIKDNWPLLLAIITGPIGIAVLLITKNWDTIKDGFTAVMSWIGDRVGDIVSFLTSLPGRVWGAISGLYELIKGGITAAANWVGDRVSDVVSFYLSIPGRVWGAIAGLYENIKGGITAARDWIRDRVNDVVSFFAGIPGRIGNVFGNVFDGALSSMRTVVNGIARAWNSTVGRLSFSIPDWVPGVGGNGFDVPDIPLLAKGGIVMRPTLALIGERGPEAVLPLDTMRNLQPAAGAAGGGGAVFGDIVVTSSNATPDDIARAITWRMLTSGV